MHTRRPTHNLIFNIAAVLIALSCACSEDPAPLETTPTPTSGWVDPNSTTSHTTPTTSSPPPQDTSLDDTDGEDTDDKDTHSEDTTPDTPLPQPPPPATQHTDQIIYLTLTDRFFNADPSNDSSTQPDCTNPNDPRLYHGGDFAGLTQQLPYLRSLGINSLWITPIYKQIPRAGRSCAYHGYWPDWSQPDTRSLDPHLGTEDELLTLISGLQDQNTGLILDMIVNHTGYNSSLSQSHPSWFHDPNTCEQLGDPTITCPLAGLPDLNQNLPHVASYLSSMTADFIQRFPLYGIRMDTIKHIPTPYLRDDWIPTTRTANPNLFLVGEHLSDTDLSLYNPYLDAGFHSLFNFRLRTSLLQTFAFGQPTSTLAARVRETLDHFGLPQALLMTNLLDNHDLPRFTQEIQGPNDTTRLQRYHLALTALLTLPGIPQLYYGNELAMLGAHDPDNRRSMPPWAWNDTTRNLPRTDGFLGNPAATFQHTQHLISLRHSTPALRSGDYFELWRPPSNDSPDLFAFLRYDSTHITITILHNDTEPTPSFTLPIASHPFLPDPLKTALQHTQTPIPNALFTSQIPSLQPTPNGDYTVSLPPLSSAVYRIEL